MNIVITQEQNAVIDGVEYITREAFGMHGCDACEIGGFCSKEGNPPCLPWERKDQRDVIFIKKVAA